MRICSPQLGLNPKSILGGEIYDREILKRLPGLGIKVNIILPLGKPYDRVAGWKVSFLPVPLVVPPHLFNFLVLPYLLNTYKQEKFDLLRIHSPTFAGVAAWIFKKIYPQVSIVGIYHWLGEGGRVESWLNPYLVKLFDGIICDSKFTKSQVENKYPVSRGKVHTIYNGVDESLFPRSKPLNLQAKLGIKAKTIVLLYMGLFIKRKNPLALLPIVNSLRKDYPDLLLLLCGSGELKNNLVAEIKKLGLQRNVRLIEPVFGKNKNDLLNLADIYVHPAINEGFSLAVIEVMAVGLPVVINAGYSASEAVTDRVNGFVVSSKAQWLEKLKLLLRDKRLRDKMKRANITKVNQYFRWDQVVKQHALLFRRLAKSQG